MEFPAFEWYWRGRVLRFTRHIREELDRERKNIEFVTEILENGEHRLESKRENKVEAILCIGKWEWNVSYVEHEDSIILIHLGKKRR